jgi:hypothetical protein
MAEGEDCIANIGPHPRRQRLWVGIMSPVAGLALLAVLMLSGAPRLWRLPLAFNYGAAVTALSLALASLGLP